MPKSQKRVYVFIDGSNLYAGQYELFGPNKYLYFPEFIKLVQKKIKTKFYKIFFYVSYSPKPKRLTKKVKQYLRNEAIFYRGVKGTNNLEFFKGYRSKTSGKEKEVDVKLAVDIVDFSHRNQFSEMYLLSGDADFMHSLKVAGDLSKGISIFSIENRIPYRFSFLYTTYVFTFFDFKGKISPEQKIKIIRLNKKNIVLKIK